MNKFFDYVLLAFCGISCMTAVVAFFASFIVDSLLGLGDPVPTICLASAFGGLYNAAICWVLHKTLLHVTRHEQ